MNGFQMKVFFRFFNRTSIVVFAGAVCLALSSFVSALPGTGGLNAAFAQSPSGVQAIEQPCGEQRNLRSREGNTPAKIRFINPTDGTYVLQWIDYNGALKEYGTLGPGAEITQDTFLTHPWIVAYGEGSCRQIFLPVAGISVARVLTESELSKKKSPVGNKPAGEPPLKCAENYKKVGNECVMMQNCGPNARRSREGDCFCNSGYHMMNGQCARPLQQSNQCKRDEVYSSSMGQCIPKSLGR